MEFILILFSIINVLVLYRIRKIRLEKEDYRIKYLAAMDLLKEKNILNATLVHRNAQIRVQNDNLMCMYQDIRNSCIVLPKNHDLFYAVKLDYTNNKSHMALFSIN